MFRTLLARLALGLHAGFFGLLAVNLLYVWRTRRDRRTPDGWPRVSVLVPARNEEANLRRLLPSLAEQDYPRFEVVVMDDGSEDGTWGVIQQHAGARVRGLRGTGPPPGWVGKVHALYAATRHARGDVYLFLDADARLKDPQALRRLVERWAAAEARSGGRGAVLSGLTHLRGGGRLLTSLIPFAFLTALPLPLVPRSRTPSLSAMNGQCWMISATAYHREEPHAALPDEVLEDVQIGRYLKRRGLRLTLRDLQGEVEVWMYGGLRAAWRGFRKNMYLMQGGTLLRFLVLHGLYLGAYVLPPLVSPWALVRLWALKAASDTASRFPLRTRLLAPLSLLLGGLLPLDSAVAHHRGRVEWKGRAVARVRGPARTEVPAPFVN
ncbi:MAG: glycosyltransferase family 2 protein [Rhodothermales bacterium]|nr:glycosyltransferase family 2 protein [Rhodothermales bacterium]